MLATSRALPASGAGYGWEWKNDGGRAIGRLHPGGRVRLDSRNGKDFTPVFPEIATALAEALPGHQLSVDGEIIAPHPGTGAPEFAQLQHRFGTIATTRLMEEIPVSYVIFDVLHLDGTPTVGLSYTDRQQLLAALRIDHPRLLVPGYQVDVDPAALLELARAHDIEGVVGKRLNSTYRPGRSPDWLKHALRNRIEVIVGGWTPGQGSRATSLGSLLLARPSPDEPAALQFVGAVGTGWTAATATQLRQQLDRLATAASPFSTPLPREYGREARYVHPELVGDVEYRSRTSEGYLRHPSWKGLRVDKTVADL